MPETEFQIQVSDREVEGFFGLPGTRLASTGAAPLELDGLTMETVVQMEALLNYWNLIAESKPPHIQGLLGERTLRVIGKQLWRLLLENEVGKALVRELGKPESQPLRLLLAFDDDANLTLRGLPWEFLFEPNHHGFLSVKTGLLLTRSVPPTGLPRPQVETVEHDQLRVLLLAALPDERRGTDFRDAYRRLTRELHTISGLAVTELDRWDRERFKKAMSSGPPMHIVHVVGICRGPPGAPEMFLGSTGDGFEDPEQLVDALTGPDAQRPQLVILHLCDYQDGDASENFERLAPALIKRQVPAVLALQYAALAEEVGVGAAFYRRLLDGDRIGAAVQKSRTEFGTGDRRFGTPVLYLGDDGPLRKPRKIEESGSSPAAGASSTTGTRRLNRDLRQKLLRLVSSADGLSEASRSSLIELVASLPVGPEQASFAREEIKLKLIGRHDQAAFELLGEMLWAVSDEIAGNGHGQG